MIYLQLFLEFFMTGLFAIGGGMATIPFLYEMSDKTGWFTHGELANMIAVGESTPGPIGVNMATYVGFLTGNGADGVAGGVLGAVVATLGLITPSVLIIIIIASILNQFRKSRSVQPRLHRFDRFCRHQCGSFHPVCCRCQRLGECVQLEGHCLGCGPVVADQCGETNQKTAPDPLYRLLRCGWHPVQNGLNRTTTSFL